MHILHINSEKDAGKIDQFIKKGSDVFILVYMEGCGPCNATRPQWADIETALKDQYANNDKLVIIDVNKDFVSNIKHIGKIDGYPTIKYIGDHGKIVESYENSSISKKDRSVSSFIVWIESKINNVISTTPTSSPQHVYSRLAKSENQFHRTPRNKTPRNKTPRNKTPRNKTPRNKTPRNKTPRNKTKNKKTKHHRGGKWSMKYKKSIDCNKPKGFSQKQHCKYGRK
jgi:thiol-disulfide isomerase/thioredoxin